jgi:hypothetical protein
MISFAPGRRCINETLQALEIHRFDEVFIKAGLNGATTIILLPVARESDDQGLGTATVMPKAWRACSNARDTP